MEGAAAARGVEKRPGRCRAAVMRGVEGSAAAQGIEREPVHAPMSVRGVGEGAAAAVQRGASRAGPRTLAGACAGRWKVRGGAEQRRCGVCKVAAQGIEREPAHAPMSVRGVVEGAETPRGGPTHAPMRRALTGVCAGWWKARRRRCRSVRGVVEGAAAAVQCGASRASPRTLIGACAGWCGAAAAWSIKKEPAQGGAGRQWRGASKTGPRTLNGACGKRYSGGDAQGGRRWREEDTGGVQEARAMRRGRRRRAGGAGDAQRARRRADGAEGVPMAMCTRQICSRGAVQRRQTGPPVRRGSGRFACKARRRQVLLQSNPTAVKPSFQRAEAKYSASLWALPDRRVPFMRLAAQPDASSHHWPPLALPSTPATKSVWKLFGRSESWDREAAAMACAIISICRRPNRETGSCGYVVYQYYVPAAVERFTQTKVTSQVTSQVVKAVFIQIVIRYLESNLK
ncbi:hypothetical protein GGX14DRAFT_622694 [Mycena pura]|uniref:Uncharacterized protein n=1 Tax=Mycena pura TaxID=153505 RepID=A0AAD6VGF4_9AGAR|nr:hypothetical protein GGX14DRAFT_622694 [Mycena pura]